MSSPVYCINLEFDSCYVAKDHFSSVIGAVLFPPQFRCSGVNVCFVFNEARGCVSLFNYEEGRDLLKK